VSICHLRRASAHVQEMIHPQFTHHGNSASLSSLSHSHSCVSNTALHYIEPKATTYTSSILMNGWSRCRVEQKYDGISKQPRRMATAELRCKIFESTTPPSRPGITCSYGVALPLLMLFGVPRRIATADPEPRLLPEGPCLKDCLLEIRPGRHATIASLIYTSLFPLIVLPLDSYSATAICAFVHSLQATGSG
jgi:hypothetical protein